MRRVWIFLFLFREGAPYRIKKQFLARQSVFVWIVFASRILMYCLSSAKAVHICFLGGIKFTFLLELGEYWEQLEIMSLSSLEYIHPNLYIFAIYVVINCPHANVYKYELASMNIHIYFQNAISSNISLSSSIFDSL